MIFVKLAAPIMAGAVIFTGNVVQDNFTNFPAPMKIKEAQVNATSDHNSVHLIYSAKMQIEDTVDMIIHRTVTCGPRKVTVELPDIVKRYEPGTFNVNILTMNAPIPPGADCTMDVALNWLPTLSWYDHVQKLEPVSFSTPYRTDRT